MKTKDIDLQPCAIVVVVELAGAALARLSPGLLQLAVAAVAGEAMHPGVAVPVGHVQVAVGRRHQFRRVVER